MPWKKYQASSPQFHAPACRKARAVHLLADPTFVSGSACVFAVVFSLAFPSPFRLVPCGVLAQFCAGPSLWVSGYLVASRDGPVALLYCLGCCSTPWCMCSCGALYFCTEVFILG